MYVRKDVQSTKTSTKCWAVVPHAGRRAPSASWLSPAPAPRPRAQVQLRTTIIYGMFCVYAALSRPGRPRPDAV
eukprot:5449028-Prymnesium_polylepis.3